MYLLAVSGVRTGAVLREYALRFISYPYFILISFLFDLVDNVTRSWRQVRVASKGLAAFPKISFASAIFICSKTAESHEQDQLHVSLCRGAKERILEASSPVFAQRQSIPSRKMLCCWLFRCWTHFESKRHENLKRRTPQPGHQSLKEGLQQKKCARKKGF